MFDLANLSFCLEARTRMGRPPYRETPEERFRDLLALQKKSEGVSVRETAKQWGCSASTIARRRRRAKTYEEAKTITQNAPAR